jgi:hypothetical protein
MLTKNPEFLFNVAKRLAQPFVSSRSCLFGVGQFISVEADPGDFSELHMFSDDNDFDPFEFPREDANYDVITKTPLDQVAVTVRVCTRCSGLVEKRQLDLDPTSGVSIRGRRWRGRRRTDVSVEVSGVGRDLLRCPLLVDMIVEFNAINTLDN